MDEQTQILYENHVVGAEEVAKDYAKWEGARKVSFDNFLSTGPKDLLVLRDIFDAPLEIVRDPKYKNLVIKTETIKRKGEGPLGQYSRPYSTIILTPTKGQIDKVINLQEFPGGMSFNLKEAGVDDITFDNIKNDDLEMRINYKSK